MTYAQAFSAGQRVKWDGAIWTIAAIETDQVTLTSGNGRASSFAISEFINEVSMLDPGPADSDEPGVGESLTALSPEQLRELEDSVAHVQEVLTGYRSGNEEQRRPDEPRPEYAPGVSRMDRYAAKAAELGVSQRTVRRMVERFSRGGTGALIDGRQLKESSPFGTVDTRWVDMARAVLAEHTDAARPTKKLITIRVNARVLESHGPDVALPSSSTASRVLDHLADGTNAFKGSAKAKRSIADRPPTPYGHLVAMRPGEFLMLDTTPLDVFALDRLTNRWCRCELTIAMDVFTRCIVALRLSAMSTKAVDAALVLFEAVTPESRRSTSGGLMPYGGVPNQIVVDADRTESERLGLPAATPETIIVDHGRIYLSQHLFAVCERFGMSIQPARVGTPTDKPMCERFFRTIRETVLEALPGYKGPDIYSRGSDAEDEAYYFIDELEQILRDWVVDVYHQRPHQGLMLPEAPATALTPRQMFNFGVARAGSLKLPTRADLAVDFLPVTWRKIQHYGVDFKKLRFDAVCLNRYRNSQSPWGGRNAGKWPFRYDPDDITALYFQEPETRNWERVPWVRADELNLPFSIDSLDYVRRSARKPGVPFDEVAALSHLLERWQAGVTQNVAERRMAIRLDEQRQPRGTARFQEAEPYTPMPLLAAHQGPCDADDNDTEDDFAVPDEEFYDQAFGTEI